MDENIAVQLIGYAPGEVIVGVEGELHEQTADQFRSLIAHYSMAGRTLVLDMSGLTFLSSVGLRSIIALQHRLDAMGASLVLTNARGLPERVLRATGLGFLINDPRAQDVT